MPRQNEAEQIREFRYILAEDIALAKRLKERLSTVDIVGNGNVIGNRNTVSIMEAGRDIVAIRAEQLHVHLPKAQLLALITEALEPIRGLITLSVLSGRRNRWLVIVSEGTDYLKQTCLTRRGDFPLEAVNRKLDQGYQITHLGFGAGYWVIILSKGSGYRDQKINVTERFPYRSVKRSQAKGIYVTSVAYGRSKWVVVSSRGSGFSGQLLPALRSSYPKAWIKRHERDYRVTKLAYGNRWAVVLSKGTGWSKCLRWAPLEFPLRWIKDKSSEGRRITTLTYGPGKWGIILYKGSGFNTQTLYACEACELDSLISSLNEGRYVTAITYGPLAPESDN